VYQNKCNHLGQDEESLIGNFDLNPEDFLGAAGGFLPRNPSRQGPFTRNRELRNECLTQVTTTRELSGGEQIGTTIGGHNHIGTTAEIDSSTWKVSIHSTGEKRRFMPKQCDGEPDISIITKRWHVYFRLFDQRFINRMSAACTYLFTLRSGGEWPITPFICESERYILYPRLGAE